MSRIKIGKQYMPGEVIPAGEKFWYYHIADKSTELLATCYGADHTVTDGDNLAKFRFHLDYRPPRAPKEPKLGEWWEIRGKLSGDRYIAERLIGKWRDRDGGIAAHDYEVSEVIRQWKPVDSED